MPSILESIAENVYETLADIREDNEYADWTVTLDVHRAKKKNEPRHMRAVIYQLPQERTGDDPMNAEDWTQPFAVVVYVIPDEGDETPIDSYNNEIAASMHKALMTDYTRGGYAINTIIQPTLYFQPVEGEFGGITFMFDVQYRIALDNPFSDAN